MDENYSIAKVKRKYPCKSLWVKCHLVLERQFFLSEFDYWSEGAPKCFKLGGQALLITRRKTYFLNCVCDRYGCGIGLAEETFSVKTIYFCFNPCISIYFYKRYGIKAIPLISSLIRAHPKKISIGRRTPIELLLRKWIIHFVLNMWQALYEGL